MNESIIIIGAGFAGLSAGIYAQMNGYKTEIFESHNLPGGLCTSWKRKGYTIDGCIHWLVGSSPDSGMHRYWKEVGIAQGRQFVYADEYIRYEATDGRLLVMYTDLDRLEQEMLRFAPRDAAVTKEFIRNVRACLAFDAPPDSTSPLKRFIVGLKMGWLILTKGRQMKSWLKTTGAEFANRFSDPVLRDVITSLWFPEFSVFFVFTTLAWLHRRNAGYPIGGSMPMSEAMEKRYRFLGGTVHYRSKVTKILTEGDRAVGVRLDDGTEHRADRIISAADGYSTIFTMLDGRYADEKTREPYEKWLPFPPLIYVGLGVNRSFSDEPKTVSGTILALPQPVQIAESLRNRLSVHIFNQDPTLSPEGKTTLVVMMPSSYEYWKELANDRERYDEMKSQVAKEVIRILEGRFPGIGGQVEMVDVATPLTFERYTGNWKGSFEGWQITPKNAYTMMRPMSQTLPGLSNVYMCGQWVQPGGGLPTAVMSARRLIGDICKEDRKRFHAMTA